MAVGNTLEPFDPFTPAALADPYPVYARYRAEEPVHYSERRRSWFVFGHELVNEAFRHPALTAERSRATKHAGRPGTLRAIDQEGRNHQVVRTTLTRSLYPMVPPMLDRVEEVVASMADAMEAAIDRFIDERLVGEREVDLVTDFAYPLVLVTGASTGIGRAVASR
jgi:cytochrome P450